MPDVVSPGSVSSAPLHMPPPYPSGGWSSEAPQPGTPAAGRLCCPGGTAPVTSPGLQCTEHSVGPCHGTAVAMAEGAPRLHRTGAPRAGRPGLRGSVSDGVPSGEGNSFSQALSVSGRDSQRSGTQGNAAGRLGRRVLGRGPVQEGQGPRPHHKQPRYPSCQSQGSRLWLGVGIREKGGIE